MATSLQHRPTAGEYDNLEEEDRNPVKAASRHRVEEANRKRNEEKEEAALSVDVTKFERAAWLLTAGCLVIVAVSVHVLTRFHYGFKWVATSLLAVAPLYLWLSSNIRESFLAEVRERKADAAKDPKPQKAGDPTILDSESAEWMNAVIAKLWPIINTDLALPMLDIVEDALKDKYPKLIDTVRIEELDLGVTPFRIVRMKYLDPESRISEGHDVESDSSRFVNMEVDFEYRGENRKVASDNLHMLIYMGLGPSKLATIEIPTFAELSHASGTMRIRMELISDPPFAETATVSFPQMPDFTLSARPLKSVDVMRFPLMTSYVKKAVGDVISRFIAPDAFSLNVARLIMGQDVDLTTQAQGLMVVVLHSAYGLSNTDKGSKSDPFVIISWAKLGKTLYTSRVILNELHPQWEEAVFIPVPPDALRDGDRLCITVWDSDRFTADDSLGKAELNINDLYDNAGKMQTFDEPLSGAIRKGNNKGNVKFSAGYFKKADVSSGSTKAPAGTLVSMRVGDAGAPLEADSPKNERARHYSSRIKDTMDAKIPPSPKQSSGILAIQLHQMDELDIQQKNAVPGLGDSKVETNTPSTYAQIFVNDDLIFTTRLKRLSSSPYINARTEVFCKDWTRTRVDVVILDYRERENDAVLGVISLRLADILANTSQVSSWRPLLGGIGTGRCRLSILFKPIHIYLPPTLKGWNVGTMLIDQIKGHNIPANFKGKIVVNMAGTKVKTSTTVQSLEDGSDQRTVTWKCQPPLRIPMLRRYQRALSFKLVDISHNLGTGKTLGEGILWMSNVVDDTASEPEIRLYSGEDVKRRRYNHDNSLAEGISADTPEDSGRHISDIRRTRSAVQSSEGVEVHQEGLCLQVSLRFSRGLSSLHSTLLGDVAPASLQDTLRMREHAIQAGERKTGSARFNHRDAAQKADRERNLAQARDAASDKTKEHESAMSSSNTNQLNLGSIPAAEGGGLAEIPRSALNEAEGQGEAGDQDEVIDEEDWEEEDAAEDAEKDASNNKGLFAEKREDFKSDRMHERGIFQLKIGRTAKWLKDSSRRKGHDLRNKFGHTDNLPMAPETENISHLT